MIGIQTMKKSILDQLIYFIQELHLGKEKETSDFKHTVLYGPPGTGKTEIAKIIGRMYSKLGILKKNVFKKATRSELIAGYLGQTAIKTKKIIDECLGGVLFIDEAYSLASGDREDSYSKECLDTLCEALSDHKNDLMVIIAGYEDELNETFFRVNKGLESRFIWRFTMEEYSSKELMEIFKKKINDIEWSLEVDDVKLQKWFEDKKTNFKHFGRDMELLLTYVKIAHGKRIYTKDKDLRKNISFDDIKNGYDVFMKNKKTKKEPVFMNSIYI
jgi:SpoVK/Ycf46/Vps4 family AAA+-type ATPase